MPDITISLPSIEAEQSIEIEVKVNGKKKCFMYRVELFSWDDCEENDENRAECLKRMVGSYDQEHWQLVHIGSPSEENIPVMFRKKMVPVIDEN